MIDFIVHGPILLRFLVVTWISTTLAFLYCLVHYTVNYISWQVHLEMTRTYVKSLARGSFKDFVQEYYSHKWTISPDYPYSRFDRDTDSEIHASIVRFDGKGMLLGRIAWWRVRHLIKSEAVSLQVSKKWGSHKTLETRKQK